jgi:hypothetical protein
MAMRNPTLFDDDYDVAIYDMVDRFKRQLDSASTDLERAEIKQAIRSWLAALEPPAASKKKPSNTPPRK